jgi:hypothetical protein
VLAGRTLAARQLAAPACKHGHVWTPENTQISSAGKRYCRTCGRLRHRSARNADLNPLVPTPRTERSRGERNGMAKLTEGQVRLIRAQLAMSQRHVDIGHQMGVDPRLIGKIARGERWQHVM